MHRKMFSLFRSRRDETTEVVAGEHDFFLRLERLMPNRAAFESLGDQHGETDLRLVQKVEDTLVPVLGNWEQSTTWFHQMDYYGDGVRSLTIERSSFPKEHLARLQKLLVGEHQLFTILCIVTDSLMSSEGERAARREDDYLALFPRKILVTRALANDLSTGA